MQISINQLHSGSHGRFYASSSGAILNNKVEVRDKYRSFLLIFPRRQKYS